MDESAKRDTSKATPRDDTQGATKGNDNPSTTPAENSVMDIKELIEGWEKDADQFKIQSHGESKCLKSPGVK